MNTEDKDLNPQQSLDLILTMIKQAKGNVQDSSFYYLFWGWVIVLAQVGHFVLLQVGYTYPYAIWLLVVPGWIITFVYSSRQSAKSVSRTHLDKIYASLWISFGVLACTIPIFGSFISYQINPVILMVAGMTTFTSGFILRFNPFLAGGVALFAIGIACFFVPPAFQPLVAGAAIAMGYLVPGYLLKAQK